MNRDRYIQQSDLIIGLGMGLHEIKACDIQSTQGQKVLLSPFAYERYFNFDADTLLRYEVGSEEAVLALFLLIFAHEMPNEVKAFLDGMDIGFLSAESCLSEEEIERLYHQIMDSKESSLLIGRDVLRHKQSTNINSLLSLLNRYSPLTIIPLTEDEFIFDVNQEPELVTDVDNYDGTIVYEYKQSDKNQLIASEAFLKVAKVSHLDTVHIIYPNGESVISRIIQDQKLQGNIALSIKDHKNSTNRFLYPYQKVRIQKVNHEF